MSIPTRLREFLESHHVSYETLTHRAAFSAQRVAAEEHVPGREHAKVVVARAGDRFVLAVLPAPKKLDIARLGEVLGAPTRLASEEEFRDLFPDCEAGTMPPFGNLYGMEVIADESLEEDESVVFQAGSYTDSVRMRYEDFRNLAGAKLARIAL